MSYFIIINFFTNNRNLVISLWLSKSTDILHFTNNNKTEKINYICLKIISYGNKTLNLTKMD